MIATHVTNLAYTPVLQIGVLDCLDILTSDEKHEFAVNATNVVREKLGLQTLDLVPHDFVTPQQDQDSGDCGVSAIFNLQR